jgi:hypothetical protein
MTTRSRANPKESLTRTAAMLDAQIKREFAKLMRSLDYQTQSMRMIEARISIINQKLIKRGETVVRLRELVIDLEQKGNHIPKA